LIKASEEEVCGRHAADAAADDDRVVHFPGVLTPFIKSRREKGALIPRSRSVFVHRESPVIWRISGSPVCS
jgi:hypothetical protein